MEKRKYIAPALKVKVIGTESMICSSDNNPDSFGAKPSVDNPINSGYTDAKPNGFSYDAWGDDEDEVN